MPTPVARGSSSDAGPGIEPIVHAGCGRSGSDSADLVAERLGYELVEVRERAPRARVVLVDHLTVVPAAGAVVERLTP